MGGVTGHLLFRWRGPISALVVGGVVGAAIVLPGLDAGAVVPPLGLAVGRWLAAAGVALRILIVATALPGTSGRERTPFATAALNQAGAYSLLRHPLYLANLVAWLGVGITSGSWWIALPAVVIGCILYGSIARAEDHHLANRFGEAHRAWAERTPAFIPRPDRWRRPAAWAPWPEVVRREYASVVVVSVTVFLVESARELGRHGKGPALGVVAAVLAGSVVLSLTARTLGRSRARGPTPAAITSPTPLAVRDDGTIS